MIFITSTVMVYAIPPFQLLSYLQMEKHLYLRIQFDWIHFTYDHILGSDFIMALNEWYKKGISAIDYVDSMEKLKSNFMHIYKTFTPPSNVEFLQSLQKKNLRVIVLAEEWCGHCMLNIPILLRLTEQVDMPVRFLRRDENLELMDQYLTNGKSRTIPIFIFIDEDGNEVTKWGPLADYTKQFTDQHRAQLPAKDAEDYDEKFMKMIKMTARTFRDDSSFWDGVYTSLKDTLQSVR